MGELWRLRDVLYINKRESKKLCKLYTNPTFSPTSLWFTERYKMYSLCSKLYTNYTQTIHWDVSNPTQELYTKAYTATIHSLFLNTNQRNQTDEANEACVTKVTCVTCVTNVTGETKGRVGDGVNGTSPRCHGSRVSSFHLRAHPFWNINVHEFDSLKSH